MKTAQATLTLVNMRGLHARASNKFMACVLAHDADVYVRAHGDSSTQDVEADSVMELLLLGAACGEKITVRAEGPQAQEAIDALSKLVRSGFGEDE